MITKTQYLKAAQIVLTYRKQLEDEISQLNSEAEQLAKLSSISPETKLIDIEISVRTFNILCSFKRIRWCDYDVFSKIILKDFEGVSLKEIHKERHAGPKTIQEIKDLFNIAGVNYVN